MPGSSIKTIAEELKQVNRQMYERNFELAIRNRTLSTLSTMYDIMNTTLGVEDTAYKLLTAIVKEFKFRGGAICLANKHERKIKTIAATVAPRNPHGSMAFVDHFMNIELPMHRRSNLLVKTMYSKRRQMTHKLHDLTKPLIIEEQVDLIQSLFHIETFVLYPFTFGEEIAGVLVVCIDKKVSELSRSEKEGIKEVVELIGIALERAKIYANLKYANQKLKELDEMKDDFVSVASHELRTPMTAIKSYLWMALAGKGGKISPKLDYYLQRSYNSVDRLIKLVNDMLNISRIESGRIYISLAKVNVASLIQEVIDEVKPRADELKISLMFDFGRQGALAKDSVKPVIADADKIKEVVFNLIGNSLKFTPAGGSIKIYFTLNDKKIITHIQDSGRGIDKKDISTLFTKFGMVQGSYATNKKASGTGLGLYISKSIIEIHDGEILASSDGIDKGSTFSFSLPVYAKDLFARMNKKFNTGGRDQTIGIIHSGF